MLCAKCQELCSSIDPHQDNDIDHYGIVEELCTSANSGCLLCKLIHKAFKEKPYESINALSMVTIKTKRNIGIEVSLVDPAPKLAGSKSLVVYVIFQSIDLPRRFKSTLQLLEDSNDTNTGSEAAFQLTSAWLEECLETHKRCLASATGDPPLPRRVIDVGSIEGDDLTEPYLLETFGQRGKYLTLSHCWGGGSPIKTTKENIERHWNEIKLANLPRTFRDAVHVTRKLGYKYLWIDSLCIIQDDRKDWEFEAVMMHQYYKQSLLTIAAAAGNNSDAGLFQDRDGLNNRPVKLQFTDINSSSRQLYAYTNSMSFELQISSLSSSYKPIPLYDRAWVFQEQALSPRTLTYAQDRSSWRCQEMLFDERAPLVKSIEEFIKNYKTVNIVPRGGDPRSTDATIAKLQRKWIFPAPIPRPGYSFMNIGNHERHCYLPEDEFLMDWGKIVQDYTQRDMTYHSDKLIAIQGIADAVAPIVSRTYFAGIWDESMRSVFMGLLWSSKKRRSKQLHKLDIAPSWSWASTDGVVTWMGYLLCQLESRIKILELKRSGTAVKATAELIAEVNLRPAFVEDNKVFSVISWPEESTETLSMESINASPNSRLPLDMLETPVALDESLGSNVQVWFAELASGKVHAQQHRKEVHCLVLISCGDNPSAFRRVGYSIWKESKWTSPELPEARRKTLRIL
ncbi:heterokaryon incompatibility protein-domain-containing protein [Tricladium varicosporioides]|nr:heterokaryon incompatibility protein-domain-containing protein [Hymenoscyphus varicosporioides]